MLAGALVLLLLYGFWRIGKLWPGVPPAEEGMLHMNQVGLPGWGPPDGAKAIRTPAQQHFAQASILAL